MFIDLYIYVCVVVVVIVVVVAVVVWTDLSGREPHEGAIFSIFIIPKH